MGPAKVRWIIPADAHDLHAQRPSTKKVHLIALLCFWAILSVSRLLTCWRWITALRQRRMPINNAISSIMHSVTIKVHDPTVNRPVSCPKFNNMNQSIWKACEKMNIREPCSGDSFAYVPAGRHWRRPTGGRNWRVAQHCQPHLWLLKRNRRNSSIDCPLRHRIST